MKKFALATVGNMAMILFFLGCTKNSLENLNEDEARIYITNHDNSADFKSYTTFSIADSVAIIKNNTLEKIERTSFDANLINAFTDMMQQREYVQVSKDNNPDLVINISRIYNDITGLIDYSIYYNNYFGYYDPFYWGYPGYNYLFPPVFYASYTIQVGGVNIDMFDAKNAGTNQQLKLLWNGLIRGSGTFDETNINNNIMALFDQSPYLDNS